jgi:putative transposase
LEQPRSSQRYVVQGADRDRELVQRMLALAKEHPRYGYRRITALLRREDGKVNRKRVYRLWRHEGLQVPVRQRKRRHKGSSANSCTRRKSERPNQVWSYDFVMDQTEDGRRLKWLAIVDEFTRECLRLEVARTMEAVDVVAILAGLVTERGLPEFIRSDNGPEFIAKAVQKFLVERGGETAFIAPGAPWENAYSETFNSRLGDELLKREVFTSLQEAKVLGARHRKDYNEQRPHSALGYSTPVAYAAACGAARSASLRAQPAERIKNQRLS